MAPADERRRLRVVRARAEVAAFAERVRAPGRAIAIADVAPPGAALEWSLQLAVELARHRSITLVACAFGEAPELGAGVLERASAAGVRLLARPVEPTPAGFAPVFAELDEAARQLWVCVGEPALALLEPWLGVLLSDNLPVARWLPSLRPLAGTASLVLGLPRAGLARELAARLPAP